jgi:hypothetical protein
MFDLRCPFYPNENFIIHCKQTSPIIITGQIGGVEIRWADRLKINDDRIQERKMDPII